jgi:zinc/manganese transport system permease protein
MGELFTYMAAPFAICLVLTGIHTYLGTHVLARGVIFVDLALAQIAALGTTAAFLMGFATDSDASYWISLLFTFVGAAVFSLSRLDEDRVPQEAIIGITYVVASAIAILAVDKAPHGAEHIKYLLVGSVLWVTWPAVLKTAGLYVLIGIFHYAYRVRFTLISNDPAAARRQGLNLKLWDFLFYASFGFVINSSVRIAGVLLVFSFLIVPAVVGALFTRSLAVRLAIGARCYRSRWIFPPVRRSWSPSARCCSSRECSTPSGGIANRENDNRSRSDFSSSQGRTEEGSRARSGSAPFLCYSASSCLAVRTPRHSRYRTVIVERRTSAPRRPSSASPVPSPGRGRSPRRSSTWEPRSPAGSDRTSR